jgi:hypothetical protein
MALKFARSSLYYLQGDFGSKFLAPVQGWNLLHPALNTHFYDQERYITLAIVSTTNNETNIQMTQTRPGWLFRITITVVTKLQVSMKMESSVSLKYRLRLLGLYWSCPNHPNNLSMFSGMNENEW